jgi:hypothetical protein
VTTVQGEGAAQLWINLLRAHGIEAVARGESLRHTHGLTMNGLGEVQIQVVPDDVEEARELVRAVEAGELTLDDDDEDGDDRGDGD